MYSVGLYTLGCKVSQYETEAVLELFEAAGFESRSFTDRCDVYVINTCTVTAESDAKSRKYIRRAIRTNPDAVVCVMGCYSQRAPEEVAAIDGVSVVIGTENKTKLPGIVKEILDGKMERHISTTDVKVAEFEPMCISRAPRTRAYLKIEDGCECKCTYCAIHDARGRVRSKPKDEVIKEVEALAKSGVGEIVLTGIETASYGKDFNTGYTLADLLCELDARKSCKRIRLGSLAPELIDEKFVMQVKDLKILAPHFHLSVQSGSDAVLRAMKRRYNAKTALANIERIRENIKGATFTTDLMVGFPGEGREEFERTVLFLKEARFIDAHIFAYSKRHGTPAATYENQVPEDEKERRSRELIEVARTVKNEVLDEIVKRGEPLSLILETEKGGVFVAHSAEFLEATVKAPGKKQGDFVMAVPVLNKNGVIHAEMIENVNKN